MLLATTQWLIPSRIKYIYKIFTNRILNEIYKSKSNYTINRYIPTTDKKNNSQHIFVDSPSMSLYECYRNEAQSPVVASASHSAANIISDEGFANTPIAKAIIKKHPEIKMYMKQIKPNISKSEIQIG